VQNYGEMRNAGWASKPDGHAVPHGRCAGTSLYIARNRNRPDHRLAAPFTSYPMTSSAGTGVPLFSFWVHEQLG
jgi:hypothetical protein